MDLKLYYYYSKIHLFNIYLIKLYFLYLVNVFKGLLAVFLSGKKIIFTFYRVILVNPLFCH